MAYPQMVEYNQAVQNPRTAFSDPELQSGKVKENHLGLPLPLSGGFALTYSLQTSSGRRLAVRCFHRQIPSVETRYSAIAKTLASLKSGYFVDFAYQERGIRVGQGVYPLVRMDWVEGSTLGDFLECEARNPATMEQLRTKFWQLAATLTGVGMAHGDLQNGNVMVTSNGLRLIDYDGMFVPGLTERQGSELGHRHFQHPKRTEVHFGPNMDRFSFICIDVSLQALTSDPALHDTFKEGGETIIFKANDFADPGRSPVFRRLLANPCIKQQVERFAAVCQADIAAVPTLEDFIAGRSIPPQVVTIAPIDSEARRTYIPAFPVLDAANYQAATSSVGQRVEIIGKITEVKAGKTKRHQPYVFINFGHWRGRIVKITIWSEGLGNFTARPDSSWHGGWISVTGLVDPPYESRRHHYTHIGITVTAQSQIQRISTDEALYRLGRDSGDSSTNANNEEILKDIRGGSPRKRQARIAIPTVPGKSPNQVLLEQIRGSAPGGATRPQPATTPAQPPPAPRTSGQQRSGQSPDLCFVASAIFCGSDVPQVATLRRYRDEVMARSPTGRLFVRAYRQVGPFLARVVLRHPSTRRYLRPMLDRIARRVQKQLQHREVSR